MTEAARKNVKDKQSARAHLLNSFFIQTVDERWHVVPLSCDGAEWVKVIAAERDSLFGDADKL